ncbi:MAG: KpsF/GutQ family sugar-phosphate isomerase [Magnetovibrio sp.]|nr:KpsF/GutQ family sugar-phosphate isomerase [Magnetovibrio sp.]|tara:strand:- start:666 stop:1643 length:978 start_codon:yes stop_codon:yes gene_type:complete
MTATKSKLARDLLESAKKVLRLETKGLQALSDSLNETFNETLDLLLAMQGRAVVTGMGKSGHIANKIAATMASTGTPAFFVHPGEASHGDLGMITSGDVVIALSFSGETAELADLVSYTKRFAIPLIGVTGSNSSALAEAASVALVLPAITEACPMGLAPTTSTTVMLALGDALAVALLESKGFSSDDFQVFHPGGKLGDQLQKVADVMHTGESLPLVPNNIAMSEAILVMTAKSFGCLGVVDKYGVLQGVITDGDLRRHMGPELLNQLTGQVMTTNSTSIRPEALVNEALRTMTSKFITALFVLENEQPIGIIHIHDCLRVGVA